MSQTGHNNISKIISISLAVLALILLLLYMQGSFVSKVAPGLSPQSSDSNPPKSQTALVELKQVGDILTWPGTVRSRTVANIAPRMTARILEIKVNAGDKVKKGDVIARLDEREIRAQENAALAALAGANAQANRAKDGYSSWAEGVGEKLERISLHEQWVVVIKPECHVNTKEIFLAKNLTRNSKSITIGDFIAGQHQNDCVEVVCQRYQPVKDALVVLSEFSEARLTGTGACVFAQFDSEDEAVNAYESLKNKWQVYLAKGLNESPLFSRLKAGKYIS